jgi:hypothetical protein
VEVGGKVYAKDNLTAAFAEAKASAKPEMPMVFMNAGGGGGGSSSSSSAAAAAVGASANLSEGRLSKGTALVLNLLGYIGICGLHRFYTGQILIGVVQLLTLGGFFIWQLLDLLLILGGGYRDSQGRALAG